MRNPDQSFRCGWKTCYLPQRWEEEDHAKRPILSYYVVRGFRLCCGVYDRLFHSDRVAGERRQVGVGEVGCELIDRIDQVDKPGR